MNYIITNKTNPDLCWSNTEGWTVDNYDTFNEQEHATLKLPMDGVWEQVPWSKAQ